MRACPREPDNPTCRCETLTRARHQALAERRALPLGVVRKAPDLGVPLGVQFPLYMPRKDRRMKEVSGCIEFLRASATVLQSKSFRAQPRGDAGPVFETVRQAFLRFGPAEGHVTIALTASANRSGLARDIAPGHG